MLVFAALLALTLCLKFEKPYPDGRDSHRKLSGFLIGAGLQVADTEFWTGGMPIIRGRRGDCQVFLLSVSSPGWANEMIHRLASPEDRVFSALDGRVYAGQPEWRIALRYHWSKVVRDITLSPRVTMVAAVIEHPSCNAEAWDWGALSGPRDANTQSAGT